MQLFSIPIIMHANWCRRCLDPEYSRKHRRSVVLKRNLSFSVVNRFVLHFDAERHSFRHSKVGILVRAWISVIVIGHLPFHVKPPLRRFNVWSDMNTKFQFIHWHKEIQRNNNWKKKYFFSFCLCLKINSFWMATKWHSLVYRCVAINARSLKLPYHRGAQHTNSIIVVRNSIFKNIYIKQQTVFYCFCVVICIDMVGYLVVWYMGNMGVLDRNSTNLSRKI